MTFFRLIAYLACALLPKRAHAVIYGWPDHEDNLIALERALSGAPEIGRITILTSNPETPLPWQLGGKSRRLKKNSIAGFLAFARSRYVFFTHPCFLRRLPSSMISVNVWHGMPIKRIGWLLDGNQGIASSHAVATSPFWADIMDRSMKPQHPTMVTGLPRNDRLFTDRKQVLDMLGIPADSRFIVWLPTYRRSILGELREDGHDYDNAFAMPDIDPDSLNDFLAKRNTSMLVKPHPMAEFGRTRIWSHLKIVDNEWLSAHKSSLYQTLAAADVLISDVSSVVIDYLLLDRPIIHAFPDLQEYRDTRGFSVEPVEDYLCGPVVTSQKELLDVLERTLHGDDIHTEKRRRMLELSHTHRDGNSTARLLEAIGIHQ